MIQKLKATLDADDRAVSPVIGVILMVAITVILAAVIASLTLGLGDSAQTAPTAKFDFEENAAGDVTVTHASGATIAEERVRVVSGSTELSFGSDVSAGTSMTINDGDISGGTVKVIWTSEDGGSSSTLATYTVQ